MKHGSTRAGMRLGFARGRRPSPRDTGPRNGRKSRPLRGPVSHHQPRPHLLHLCKEVAIAGLRAETFETQVEKSAIWAGDPKTLRDMIASYNEEVGGFEIASLQANFHNLPYEQAIASARLFSKEVMPHFR